jgi:uncharacterized membrane protein YgaE (UPF0421/DUF939 family)
MVSDTAQRATQSAQRAGAEARRRILNSFAAVLLAAVAATLAWLVAHRVLGHTQPFFAPIAAAISLSTSQIQRSRRIAQMVAGVLLGIVVAELMRDALGTSASALGLIVLVTMVLSLAVGAGFFGDGLMFPNQAVASAVLVVTVHRHGTGAERAVDVLVGGAIAFVVGVGLFPSQPLRLLADAESDLLRMLSAALSRVVDLLRTGGDAGDEWTLRIGHDIHRQLAALARARSTARVNVRVAPRRWRLRAAVDAEVRRTARLDLLANAVLSLIRAATVRADGDPLPAPGLQEQIEQIAQGLAVLADADRPWPPTVLTELETAAGGAIAYVTERGVDHDQVVGSILRATARDLISVIEIRV